MNNQPEKRNNDEKEKSALRNLIEWILTIVIAVAIALILKNFVFTHAVVSGPSMNPTLNDREHLIVWRLGYKPERGDIIVFQLPGKAPYVKRIIGVEGDEVTINFVTHEVSVNGKVLEEEYIDEATVLRGDMEYPEQTVKVAEDTVFVLGDNRNNSKDSRSADVGLVDEKYIMGEACLRFWPLSQFGTLK